MTGSVTCFCLSTVGNRELTPTSPHKSVPFVSHQSGSDCTRYRVGFCRDGDKKQTSYPGVWSTGQEGVSGRTNGQGGSPEEKEP